MSNGLYAMPIGDVDQSGGCSGGEICGGGPAVVVVMTSPGVSDSCEVIVLV